MSRAYFIPIQLPAEIEGEAREAFSLLLGQLGARFHCLGIEDWSVDLPAHAKILGVEREFHDLRKAAGGKLSQQVRAYFGTLKAAGSFGKLLQASFPELTVGKPRPQAKRDWMKEWRKHYKPVWVREGGEVLLITPAWRKIPKGARAVRIYPGQAFGTGTHPTTRLCLRLFLQFTNRLPQKQWRTLDFGAGTGILALAAARVARGRKVKFVADAVESDPDALAQARKNAGINRQPLRYAKRIPPGRSYDLIFANVLAPVLVHERDKLRAVMRSGGCLIVSGILASEGERFLRDFALGVPAAALQEGDWVAYAFTK